MIAWSAIAHLVRDGFPALGSTHLARFAGGAIATAGAWTLTDLHMAAVLGSAVWAGFYTDMQHGEANEGDWRPGIVSGVSSLAPLAVAAAVIVAPWWGTVAALGLIKPPIWRAAWALNPARIRRQDWYPLWAFPLAEPTRVAAMAWGALVGATIVAIGVQA